MKRERVESRIGERVFERGAVVVRVSEPIPDQRRVLMAWPGGGREVDLGTATEEQADAFVQTIMAYLEGVESAQQAYQEAVEAFNAAVAEERDRVLQENTTP